MIVTNGTSRGPVAYRWGLRLEVEKVLKFFQDGLRKTEHFLSVWSNMRKDIRN